MQCDTRCGRRAGFIGMGRVLCWICYSSWILSFRHSDSLRVCERHPQIPFDFEQDSDTIVASGE